MSFAVQTMDVRSAEEQKVMRTSKKKSQIVMARRWAVGRHSAALVALQIEDAAPVLLDPVQARELAAALRAEADSLAGAVERVEAES